MSDSGGHVLTNIPPVENLRFKGKEKEKESRELQLHSTYVRRYGSNSEQQEIACLAGSGLQAIGRDAKSWHGMALVISECRIFILDLRKPRLRMRKPLIQGHIWFVWQLISITAKLRNHWSWFSLQSSFHYSIQSSQEEILRREICGALTSYGDQNHLHERRLESGTIDYSEIPTHTENYTSCEKIFFLQ